MNKLIATISAAGLLTGCNATKFNAAKAGGGGEAFGSVFQSADDPAVNAACNAELKKRGLKYGGGWWRKKMDMPCGYTGIGYIEAEVEVNAAADHSCEHLADLDRRLEGKTPMSEIIPDRQLAGVPNPENTAAFRWNEKQRHCAQTNRCGNSKTPAQAMGRLVWVKKCEASVPEFKAFLDTIRRVENCAVNPNNRIENALGGNTCLFSSNGSPLFPLVLLNGSAIDNAPAPAVTTGQVTSVDELAQYTAQVGDPCPAPADVAPIDTVCSSGCYRADQRLLTAADGKYQPILAAKEANTPTIAVLSRASTLEAPLYVNAKVGRYVASVEDDKETLLTFSTASGARLTVTTNHPLVDGAGFMREASSFKVGEPLVRVDGARDPIVGIGKENFFGKVYNVAPISAAPEDNLVVSEGLINGSHNYQTVLRAQLNRQILRSNLSKGF